MTAPKRWERDLQEVLGATRYRVLPASYQCVRLQAVPADLQGHLALVQLPDEITLITTADRLLEIEVAAQQRISLKAIAVTAYSPFFCAGFIAVLTQGLAERGINVLVVSTFGHDLLLVRELDLSLALEALLALGVQAQL
jgi:hypothetical protein